VNVGKTASVQITLTNTGNADLHITKVQRHSTFFENVFTASGISVPFTLPVGKDTTFTVSFSPVDTGTIADSIVFSSADIGTSAYYFGVRGYGVAPVVQSDSVLTFGVKQINKTRTRNIAVQNTGNGMAKLSQFRIIGADSADFNVTIPGDTMNIAAGASKNIAVSFAPLMDGARSASLVFTADDSLKTHTVALSGEGIDSLISYPSLVCFAPNGSGDTTIYICNGGEDTLKVQQIVLQGVNQIDFDSLFPSLSTLAPGECGSLAIHAQLDSLSYSAQLTVQFDSQTIHSEIMTNCGSSTVSESSLANEFLIQHYPEPFTGHTTFLLGTRAFIEPNSSLAIYDILGREVGRFPAGELTRNTITFSAEDLPAGVYYYRFVNGTKTASGEMMHLR
ncbi:MAG TPA: choice-of-anchor D domain-containing protein, partial [Candidatus Kapabacteria bacterium]|nr:choice-of-anchor D domain-containing protein [Candidatus Kapabacteria bacterium]